MGVESFVVQLIIVFCLTIFLLNKYGNWRKQHLIVSISTFIGWYFSFVIILILPLDISMTFYEKCLLDELELNKGTGTNVKNVTLHCDEPKGYVPTNVLLGLWRIVYWTSLILTWILLPLMQSYSKAGEFKTFGRLKSAVYNNVIYYGTYAFTFIFLMIYAISKGVSLNVDHLKILIVSSSNTWGLFLLVLLLGYGLVEVPRQLWLMGSHGYRLHKIYFDIDNLSIDKNDAEETIQEVYREAREVMNVLKSTRGNFREKAQQIMSKFPYEITKQLNATKKTPNFGNASNITDADSTVISNDAYLIRLHKRVIDAVQNHHRCLAQWQSLVTKALYLEDVDVAESMKQLPLKWARPLGWSRSTRVSTEKSVFDQINLPHSIRFFWHITLKRRLLQATGIVCAGMTLLIMWSECTFFVVHPQLSLAAYILHKASLGYHYKYIQVCTVLLLFYLSVCAYYTVFRLRIYRYYHLDSNKMTDENSLIFSAILLCRLTPPMCLNFLGMIHLDSHIISDSKFGVETQFTKLMGHLDVIPLIAKGINIYLPILIVLLCLGTWFKLGTRFLHLLGIDQFLSNDHFTTEMIQNGKALVVIERNKINREIGSEERNRAWLSKQQSNYDARDSANKNRTSLNRHEYSDQEPIIEHQDNDGIFLNNTFSPEKTNFNNKKMEPAEAEKRVDAAPSIADLEFGSAFGVRVDEIWDSGNKSQSTVNNKNGDGLHPEPFSIFDDL